MPSTDAQTFVLTGLTSRAGLSNWVFFFRSEDLVMIDVGITQSLVAGIEAGILGEVDTYGPRRGRGPTDDDAWLDDLTRKAKSVVRTPYELIVSVRVHLRMMANELSLETSSTQEFALMNRAETERAITVLAARLGPKLVVSKSGPYAFFEARAPFLVR